MELITPILYRPLYYLIVTLLTILVVTKYYLDRDGLLEKESIWERNVAILLALFFAYLIGNRQPVLEFFGDSAGLALEFQLISFDISSFQFDTETSNLLFDNLFVYMAKNGFTYNQFFLVCSTIYFFGILFACYLFFPKHVLSGYLVCLAAFTAFGSATNGFKAGTASALFLVALAVRERNLLVAIILALISWGFHHSLHVCLVSFGIALFVKSTKLYVFLWFVCIIVAAAHITYFQELLSSYTDDKGSVYLSLEDLDFTTQYLTGFRLDFVLYSAFPIFLGLYLIFKQGYRNKKYSYLLNVYIITNSAWLLCMYASYTNRIAALSWLMYPIIIIYPFLNGYHGVNQNKMLANIILLHLAFTLFMVFIYYSIASPLVR